MFRSINTAASEKTDAASKFFKETILSSAIQASPSVIQASAPSTPQQSTIKVVEEQKKEVEPEVSALPASNEQHERKSPTPESSSALNFPGLVFDKVSQLVPGPGTAPSVTVNMVDYLALNEVSLVCGKDLLNAYRVKVFLRSKEILTCSDARLAQSHGFQSC